MKKESTKVEESTSVGNEAKLPVMRRFFRWFTPNKIIGLSITVAAFIGDNFLGWEDNILFYLLGVNAMWWMSDNGA